MTPSRILVVDDEADISTILAVTLRRAGFDVETAGDGVDAIEQIHRQPPDLVILDVMMPRADGLETLKRIREHGPTAQLPVIMLRPRRSSSTRSVASTGARTTTSPSPSSPPRCWRGCSRCSSAPRWPA